MATISEVLNHPAVYSSSEWHAGNAHRIYINLKGRSKNHRGDSNVKLWIDKTEKTIHWEKGKGVLSDEMIASMRSIESAFGFDFWVFCRTGVKVELDADAAAKYYN